MTWRSRRDPILCTLAFAGLCLTSTVGCDPPMDGGVDPAPADGELPDGGPGDATSADDAGPDPADTGPTEPAPLAFDPPAVSLAPAGIGALRTAFVEVTPAGDAPVTLTAIRLEGAPGFELRLGATDPVADPRGLDDPDGDGEPGLAPGGGFTLAVRYRVAVEETVEARVVIETDRGEATLAVFGNRGVPRVCGEPERIVFGSTLVGRPPQTLDWRLESCGSGSLRVVAITIEADHDAFTVGPLRVEPPFSLPPADLDAPGGPVPFGADVPVTFDTAVVGDFEATLRIETDDPDQPILDVPLSGQITEPQCPTAAVAEATLDAIVGEPVTLDGSPSTAQPGDGRPIAFDWTVLEQPDGSQAMPREAADEPDDRSTPTAQLTPDVAGRYVVELVVADALGVRSPGPLCDNGGAPSRVVIDAAP